jgi:hypothetical protein
MFDGAELARAIAAHLGDAEAALAAYEAALLFGDRAPFGLVEAFTDELGAEPAR